MQLSSQSTPSCEHGPVTRERLTTLVHSFYADVRADARELQFTARGIARNLFQGHFGTQPTFAHRS